MSLFVRHYLFKKTLYGAAAMLFLAGTAFAQTETETFTSTAWISYSQNSTEFTLPAFDSSLGTLEDVSISFAVVSAPTIHIFDSGRSTFHFTDASMTMPYSVTSSSGLDFNSSVSTTVASGIATPGMNSYPTKLTYMKSSEMVDPSLFNLWENQPDNQIDFTVTKGNPTFTGTALGNNLFFGGGVRARDKIKIEYTFLVAPEPSGKYLSAIVAAAMMLIVIGRKRLLSA